jgi:hypothetical protein
MFVETGWSRKSLDVHDTHEVGGSIPSTPTALTCGYVVWGRPGRPRMVRGSNGCSNPSKV